VIGLDDVEGKTYRVDTTSFFPQDVAVETSVVDGIGQRLTLSIENIRGGGGQRRISVFCPFWIVNTTEHALRYRQEKSKSFVSGTVLSPSKDGSIPLSGGHARAKYDSSDVTDSMKNHPCRSECTIFSGAPGALATSAGRSLLISDQIAVLLDGKLPIERLSRMAFMFNFHEGVLTLGHQRLCAQLGDGTTESRYTSNWSRGFSLDSVGFSQDVR
jgi:SHR-binding domain of vacuolar-sorting associated protein 13